MKIFHLLLATGITCLLASCNDSNPTSEITAQQQLDTAINNRSSQLAMLNSQATTGDFSNPACLTPKASDFDEQNRLTQAYINKIQRAKERGIDCGYNTG